MKKVLAVSVVLLAVGCGLTPIQSARLQKFEAQLVELSGVISGYEDEVSAIIGDIRAKKIPMLSGMAMIQEVLKNQVRDKDLYKRIVTSRDELKSLEIPWWGYAGTGILTILGALAGRHPGSQKLKIARKIIEAMVHGVQDTTTSKDKTRTAIRGAALNRGIQDKLDEIVHSLTPDNDHKKAA